MNCFSFWTLIHFLVYELRKKPNKTKEFEAQVFSTSLLISQGRAEKNAYLSMLQTGTSHIFSEEKKQEMKLSV